VKSEVRQEVVRYWMEKAATALDSARSELAADRYDFAVNRGYYACFYAARKGGQKGGQASKLAS